MKLVIVRRFTVGLLAILLLTGFRLRVLAIVRHLKRMPARCSKDATPGAVLEILFVHGAGAVNAYWRLELP
jgi:hypothetical protein